MNRENIRGIRTLIGFMVVIGWMGLTPPANAVRLNMGEDQKIFEQQEAFLSHLYETTISRSADLAFDYQSRPVIGTVVLDFSDPSGKETALGRMIAGTLRAGLNQETQFFVFSQEQIKKSLGLFIQSDGDLKPSLLKWLQEYAPPLVNAPIHLLITGRIEKESESRIKVTVTLIPFYKPLSPIDVETEKGSFPKLIFSTPDISSSEMASAFAPPTRTVSFAGGQIQEQGRLLIVSNRVVERIAEIETQYLKLIDPFDRKKERGSQGKRQWELGGVDDLSCWLDGQELFIFKDAQLETQKEYYHNILSGFGAGQVWFDGGISEGGHTVSFSLFPVNSRYKKALSQSFKIKKGITTYLVIQVRSLLEGEPDISIREITDLQNRTTPFTK